MFLDPLGRIFDDELHSVDELREIVVRHSSDGHLLLVSFTERERGLFASSALDVRPGESETTMKRTNMAEDIHNQEEDDLLPEYRFDYTKARPNRFAEGIAEGSLVVVLEPELAQVFKTSDLLKKLE